MAQALRGLFTRKIKTYSIGNQKLIFHFQNARIKKMRIVKHILCPPPPPKKRTNDENEMKM